MLRGGPRAWAPGRHSDGSGFPGLRPASGRGHARFWSPYMLPADGGRPHPGPPEGQVVTLADAEPLTWAGAGPLTWAGAGPRAGGAGPHLSCSNPRPTQPCSAAAADAEPAASRAPGAPPPARGHFRDRSRPRGGPRVSVVPPRQKFAGKAPAPDTRSGTGPGTVPKAHPGRGDSWTGVGGSAEEETETGRGEPAKSHRLAAEFPLHLPWRWGQPEDTGAAGVFRRREGVSRAMELVTSHRPRGPV